ATPSGNGVAALTWLRLYGITADDAWRAKAEELLAAFAGQISRKPWGTGSLLLALGQYQRGAKEIGLVGPVVSAEGGRLANRILCVYVPHRAIAGGAPVRGMAPMGLLVDRPAAGARVTG